MTALARNNSSVPRRLFAQSIVDAAAVIDEEHAEQLIRAFSNVDRSVFLPDEVKHLALADQALPIGFNQMSIKPSSLARSLAIARVKQGTRVLEIGCGSGYSSAIMSELGAQVYSVEVIGMLAQQTRKRLDALYYHNILVRRADGTKGWHEHAPYDVILYWHPIERLDNEILTQLISPHGEVLAPVGTVESSTLTLWRNTLVCTEVEMDKAQRTNSEFIDSFRVYQIEPWNA